MPPRPPPVTGSKQSPVLNRVNYIYYISTFVDILQTQLVVIDCFHFLFNFLFLRFLMLLLLFFFLFAKNLPVLIIVFNYQLATVLA